MRHLCQEDPFCWLIDTAAGRLIVYENQADDFYGMRSRIELFLKNPLVYLEKAENIKREAQKAGGTEGGDARRRGAIKSLAGAYIPYVTVGLIIINILIFIFISAVGSHFNYQVFCFC